MSEAIDPKRDLWGGKGCAVPKEIAICPECGDNLTVMCMAWDDATGQPIRLGAAWWTARTRASSTTT